MRPLATGHIPRAVRGCADDDEPDWVVEHVAKSAAAKRQKEVDKMQKHEARLKQLREDVHQRKRRKVKPKVGRRVVGWLLPLLCRALLFEAELRG